MPLVQYWYALPARRLRLSPSVVGLVATLALLNCSGGDLPCGGPFCVTPPGSGREEATRLRAGSGDAQVGAPARELPLPLSVVVTDDDERPIPDVEVSFTVVGENGGTISEPTIRSDHQGKAQIRWILGAQLGAQALQAVATGSSGPLSGSPLTLTAQAVRPGAARILLLQAPPEAAQNGIPFDRHPVVAVLDSDNQPLGQVDVTVSLASGVGTLDGTTTVTTDAAGRATYGNLALRGPAGPRTLRFGVTDPALDIVSPAVQLGAGTATQLAGNDPLAYQGIVNSPVSPAPSVVVRDEAGNPVPGLAVTFEADRDGSVSPSSVITNDLGVAQVSSWTLGRSAGAAYSLVARIESGGSDPVTFSARPRAGAAGNLKIKVQPSPTGQSGIALGRQPVIQVTDELGNPAESGVLILATLSSGPAGTLQNSSATTNSLGEATFSDLSLIGLIGDYRLSFSAPALAGVASDPISISAGPPSRIALTAPLSPDGRSRVPLSPQPSIQLQDGGGNPIAQSGVEIRASIASGEGALGGQTSVLTNDQGLAAYTDLAIVASPGTRTLSFASISPASEVFSGPITLPSVAAVSNPTPPAPVVAGTRLVAPVSWTVVDAANQPVADAAVTISVSEGGSVEPLSTASDPSGVIQLQSWTLAQAAGSQYVQLQVVGTPVVSRVTVDALPDVAIGLQKTSGDGQSAPVNSDLPQALVVRVVDKYGNGVSGVTVQWRTCGNVGDYNTPTGADGYASAFQSTGPTPGEYCVRAISSPLAGSPVDFSYNVIGPAPSTSSSNSQVPAIPPASARQHQRP